MGKSKNKFFEDIRDSMQGLIDDLRNDRPLTEKPSMKTQCNTTTLNFSSLGSKKLQADFNGGTIPA